MAAREPHTPLCGSATYIPVTIPYLAGERDIGFMVGCPGREETRLWGNCRIAAYWLSDKRPVPFLWREPARFQSRKCRARPYPPVV